VDLAPEFPVLDGDSGKTAGVAVRFLSLRSRPLMRIANFRFVSACSGGLSAQVGFALLYVASLQTVRRSSPSRMFSAPEHAARHASRARCL